MTPSQHFQSFVAGLPAIRQSHPKALDCTRTRLRVGAPLALHALSRQALVLPERGYRCHVSRAWTKRFGGLAANAEQVLVSRGVRHSLLVLMRQWAKDGLKAAIPSDVYPVYLDLAAEVGLEVLSYPVHPTVDIQAWDAADVLLVTNPVKPRGDFLTESEVRYVLQWLAARPHRRVVIDAVYDLRAELHTSTRQLVQTNRAVVLHSLSKAWMSPLLAGVALVPASDVGYWTPVFRAEAVDREHLAEAEAWLACHPRLPDEVGGAFERAQAELAQRVAAAGLRLVPRFGDRAPGYMLQVQASFEETLTRGFIGLPGCTFGISALGVTVLSALDLVPTLSPGV